jgi:enoyl-CoA hydratase
MNSNEAAAIVATERGNGILTITLNRPEVRNAVNAESAQRIAEAMDELDAEPGLRIGVITGSSGTFSSGMDLKAYLAGERALVPGRGFAGFVESPPRKPLIAAVEGYALAGGFEIALACDLIVASSTACFGLPEVKRGLVAAGGGLLRLPQRVPSAIALELGLTGRPMTAKRAYEIGLINRLTPEGQALSVAQRLAAEVVANAPLAVQASKRVLVESIHWEAAGRWELQRAITAPVNSSDDAGEGARAFRERRPPVWHGR